MISMINDTNYAKYIKEREGFEILESQFSFVCYKIREKECFVSHCYTSKEHRQSKSMSGLLIELTDIASCRGCDRITASIDLRDTNASLTLLVALKFDFKVKIAESGIIIIEKIFLKIDNDLGEQNGNL